jgi:hypothetical protein
MGCGQTLDNLDGKQARRTGSSSPLGLLFDHGCDAFNTTVGAVNQVRGGWVRGASARVEETRGQSPLRPTARHTLSRPLCREVNLRLARPIASPPFRGCRLPIRGRRSVTGTLHGATRKALDAARAPAVGEPGSRSKAAHGLERQSTHRADPPELGFALTTRRAPGGWSVEVRQWTRGAAMCTPQACTMQCGATWKALAVWQLVALPFFFTTLEELYTGELVLPVRCCWGDSVVCCRWEAEAWGEPCGAMGWRGARVGRSEQLHTGGMGLRARGVPSPCGEKSVRSRTGLSDCGYTAHAQIASPTPQSPSQPGHAAAARAR